MADRLTGQARREFLAQHEVPEDQHLVNWWGLSLGKMTKAELRIVIDDCCAAMRRRSEQVSRNMMFRPSFLPQSLWPKL